MIDEPNRDEDYPQDYLSVDDLPDPHASLDADMAGDPEVATARVESERKRAAREHEEAIAPYLEKRVRQLSDYVTDVATEWAMFKSKAADPETGNKVLAEAHSRRELDKLMAREEAEQDYRCAQLEAVALAALRREEAGGGDER